MKLLGAIAAFLLTASPALAVEPPPDPLNSPRWLDMARQFLSSGPIVFDPAVHVTVVDLAEDPATVPVKVDASTVPGVERIIVFADLNPIQLVLTYRPVAARATLAFNFKVEQSTAVRAAALTRDGVWHVGSADVKATGGGCTKPSKARETKDWWSHLNEVRGRVWRAADDSRLRVRIQHPMDTGLAPGIPAFYIEKIDFRASGGDLIGELELHEPVSENPSLTIEPNMPAGATELKVIGRDNNGNSFDVAVPAPIRSSDAPAPPPG